MLTPADVLFLFSAGITWLLLLYNFFLTVQAFRYRARFFSQRQQRQKRKLLPGDGQLPKVTILIPAHNEEAVIYRTMVSMAMQNYPPEKLEVIVLNDASTDGTEKAAAQAQARFPQLNIAKVPPPYSGIGKPSALNYGMTIASGEVIAVYDADNTPEPNGIRNLIYHLLSDPKFAGVIGRFRTRNRNRNWLTRFINLETLGFQWMAQAGRCQFFNVVTIPGTNFLIWRHLLDEIGQWDPHALAEDTEVTIRLYQKGYRIGMALDAITWEEEPETLSVWFKQRTRWARGNMYVILKYMGQWWKLGSFALALDIFHMFLVYFIFLLGVLVSTSLFILGLLGLVQLTLQAPLNALWAMGVLLFIGILASSLVTEADEFTLDNLLLVAAMYFSYSQMWLVVVVRAMVLTVTDRIRGRKTKWYKTERRKLDL